jgi:GMP synthase (glutamine-hydrolysing)
MGARCSGVRVLVLQHISCEHPGVFSDVMSGRGVEEVAVELDAGDALPDWREFDSVLAMGGPMGASDEVEHGWLSAEKRLVREAVEAGRPFLGVCLGAQLLAAALDAPVYRLDRAEIGLLPVELTGEGREHPFFGGIEEPLVSLQWHGDTFELPEGAVRLASSPVAANQAFKVRQRPAFGVQFHLEVTREMAREWAEVPAYRRSLGDTLGAQAGDAFLAEVERRAEELHPNARRLFANWLDLAAAPA